MKELIFVGFIGLLLLFFVSCASEKRSMDTDAWTASLQDGKERAIRIENRNSLVHRIMNRN